MSEYDPRHKTNDRPAGKFRRFGWVVMDAIFPNPLDPAEKAMTWVAVAAASAVVVAAVVHGPYHPAETGPQPNPFVYPKTSANGDTLVSLVEHYGQQHDAWTEHHATKVAHRLVNHLGAVTKLDGLYTDYITSVHTELEPNEKVRLLEYLLEKPAPAADSLPTLQQ